MNGGNICVVKERTNEGTNEKAKIEGMQERNEERSEILNERRRNFSRERKGV